MPAIKHIEGLQDELTTLNSKNTTTAIAVAKLPYTAAAYDVLVNPFDSTLATIRIKNDESTIQYNVLDVGDFTTVTTFMVVLNNNKPVTGYFSTTIEIIMKKGAAIQFNSDFVVTGFDSELNYDTGTVLYIKFTPTNNKVHTVVIVV